jgi:4-alpha-glucanotransferase
MNQDRLSGVLLHVTSLPSMGGVGDFGPAAYEFIDFLAAAKQRLWQVLPLGPTGYGSSPYSGLSAFAGNPILISLEGLVSAGWLASDRLWGLPGSEGPADFGVAWDQKMPLIYEAAANFVDHTDDNQRADFLRYCEQNISWLPDYAMFNLLRRRFSYRTWNEWPEEFALRNQQTLSETMNECGRQLALEQAVQFLFNQQWNALREYANSRDVRILGDVAIFVSYDSADVWTNPEIFELDEQRRMIRVSGVPPDYFSATGQRWGNPLYRWDTLRDRGFDWWVARMRRALALHDMVRLDHFRGFEAYWSIAAEEETAINGQWVKAPGNDLFQRLKEVLGNLPFVAEDLGLITPEVEDLRERFNMPGMRILQFGFSDRGSHVYLPHQYVPNTVAYTGTHDNNTTLGWWRGGATSEEMANIETYLGPLASDTDIVDAMMRTAARSVANVCIFPMQDILGLASEGRMNTPAAGHGNWTWRYSKDALRPEIAAGLAKLMEMTDRDGYVAPKDALAGAPE